MRVIDIGVGGPQQDIVDINGLDADVTLVGTLRGAGCRLTVRNWGGRVFGQKSEIGRETKGDVGRPKETKGDQGRPRATKGDQGRPRGPKAIRFSSGRHNNNAHEHVIVLSKIRSKADFFLWAPIGARRPAHRETARETKGDVGSHGETEGNLGSQKETKGDQGRPGATKGDQRRSGEPLFLRAPPILQGQRVRVTACTRQHLRPHMRPHTTADRHRPRRR